MKPQKCHMFHLFGQTNKSGSHFSTIYFNYLCVNAIWCEWKYYHKWYIFIHFPSLFLLLILLFPLYENEIIYLTHHNLWKQRSLCIWFGLVLFFRVYLQSVSHTRVYVSLLLLFFEQTFCYNIKLKVGYSHEECQWKPRLYYYNVIYICETINSLAKMKYLLI